MNKSDKTRQQLLDELQELTSRMMEAEDTLRAILGGGVDGLVIKTAEGDRVFTLSGANHPYRIMVEAMNEGAVTLTADGIILFCNQRFAAIVKKPPENILGSSFYKFIPSSDFPLFGSFLKKGLKENGQIELSLQTGSETFSPVLLSINAFAHMDMPGAACMVVADLSVQKRNEKMLAEEKLITQILHQSSEILVLCDHQGCIIRASKSTDSLIGKSPIFQRFDEVFHLYYPDGTPFVLLSEISDNSFVAVEVTFRHLDRSFVFLMRANSFIISEGVTGIVVVMVDITERKSTENALRRSEEISRQQMQQIEDFYDNAPIGLCVLDRELRWVHINERLAEINGIPAAEHIGKRIRDLMPMLADSVEPGMRRVIETGEPQLDVEIETQTAAQPGIVRSWLEQWLPIKDDHGEVVGINIVVEETTERKRNEIALQKSHEDLEEQVKERTIELLDALEQSEKRKKTAETAIVEIKRLKDQLEAERAYLQEEIQLEYNHHNIIGKSDGLKYVLYKIEQIAASDTIVLVLGETGTGKELVARAIHDLSLRKNRALVKVNCATLPSNLFESELFGHEKGAFTGTHDRHLGRFEVASGATIFLDEIGELPLELQPKLLRVLQDGEFERLGGSRTIKTDARVIVATNRNLEEEVQKGRFREDLWYRVNVFSITVPPLRDRRDDIPLLVDYYVKKISKRMGKTIEIIPESEMKALQNYHWPGNIRELENVLERAVINSSGPKLRLADELRKPFKDLSISRKPLAAVERAHIIHVLEQTHWKVGGKNSAAEILGLDRSTLRARMRKLDIRKP